MQFELPLSASDPRQPACNWVRVGARHLRLHLIRNRRARRYVLRLNRDGSARVTVPRGGTENEAMRFAARNSAWLERQLVHLAAQLVRPRTWQLGTTILFRGEPVRLEQGINGNAGCVQLGDDMLCVKDVTGNLRPEVEGFLMRLARRDLPVRTSELAALHGITIRRVSVRNQRSRWGSCSRRGTISLNWRLVQAPPFVRDYIVLHELAHVKHMNHSNRFWNEVARLCPEYLRAERWLKENSELLR